MPSKFQIRTKRFDAIEGSSSRFCVYRQIIRDISNSSDDQSSSDDTSLKFRYFKFEVNDCVSDYLQMSRIEFLDSADNYFDYPSSTTYELDNFETGAAGSDQDADKLLDHDTSTKFCRYRSTTSTASIIFDLQSECLDLSIYTKWCWYNGDDTNEYSTRNPNTFSLYVSNDKENWTLVDSQTGYSVDNTNYAIAYTGYITIS